MLPLSPLLLLLLLTLTAAPASAQSAAAQSADAAKASVVRPPVTPTGSGRMWIGREKEIEEFIATAPIERFESIPIGVTKPRRGFFPPGSLVASIAFKPLPPKRSGGFFESYKSEIAAYKLDRLLGLGMVPPTVEKRVKHEVGSAQLWIEGCKFLKDLKDQKAPDTNAWNRQVYRQRVWDNLIANIDRNQGNLLVDSEWNLVLIDHSRAFTNTGQMPFPMTRIDREFFNRLKALTEEDLETHLRGLLFDGPKPLLKRRDRIVQEFEKRIAQYGEAAVLID
ncbi:MAG TPA: hypothetical protein VNK41_06860 [Vicinamibacterales bacterium]|nr:hypothetical protein [Vicinamibacterales bacterium]